MMLPVERCILAECKARSASWDELNKVIFQTRMRGYDSRGGIDLVFKVKREKGFMGWDL